MTKMIVKKSDKSGKKYVAIFTRENGRVKKTYFGQANAPDYLKTGSKTRRKLYRDRHRKDLETGNAERAGFLAFYLLWGNSTSLRENIRNYKKRFNFT